MATYNTLSITGTNVLTNNSGEAVTVTLTPLSSYFDTADTVEFNPLPVTTTSDVNGNWTLAGVPDPTPDGSGIPWKLVIQDKSSGATVYSRNVQPAFSRGTSQHWLSLTVPPPGVSGAGGRASLQTLLDEPDFVVASFLLSVLGEGSFLNLLAFLDRTAPDPVTARVAHLALQDEARHVAYGLAHLEHHLAAEPDLRDRLRVAIHRRHDALATTAGLNQQVFDALVILAAGAWTPTAISHGYDLVEDLQAEMHDGRRRRLSRLGFTDQEADELAALHTRNFM